MKFLDHIKLRVKLQAGFYLMAMLLIIVGFLGYQNLKVSGNHLSEMYQNRLMPVENLADAQQAMISLERETYKFGLITDGRENTKNNIERDIALVNSAVDKYKTASPADQLSETLKQFDLAWTNYQQAIAKIITSIEAGKVKDGLALLSENGEAAKMAGDTSAALDKLMANNRAQAGQLMNEAAQAQHGATISLGIIMLAAIASGFFISQQISKNIAFPITIFVGSLNKLKVGDLRRDLSAEIKKRNNARKDELGEIGRALGALQKYLATLAEQAATVANGDLTIEVTPLSEKDELGIAFGKMVVELRRLVGKIASNAKLLNSSSLQLADAADQAGNVTSQISMTIEQVAKGITQQSASVTQTATSVEQMTRAINSVASGAQEQASAVVKASEVTGQISSAIKRVAASAQNQAQKSTEAVHTSQSSARIVEDTVQSMETIKAKVTLSAQKVQMMGDRSQQIGTIIETIDDIAAQTNLLALNAAIEAARAGETGKGFAVVADEVRKLAEKSALAAREIGDLIHGIQQVASEATEAMSKSLSDVENGSALAEQSRQGIGSLLETSENNRKSGEVIALEAEKIDRLSNELVVAMDAVNAVVKQNTASTEEMAAGSSDMTSAIENIASVSEENSASIEEVSASAREVSTQVEEVTASAQSLAEMASNYSAIVGQFKLVMDNDTKTTPQPAPQRVVEAV